ncbi:hypothetical protein [Nocardia sp. NPDC057440]|uniref:hypothetical protein n=1 Tax=Nocardia sp. NPDC057440 TaxID=3346134 RepID=UPI0036729728
MNTAIDAYNRPPQTGNGPPPTLSGDNRVIKHVTFGSRWPEIFGAIGPPALAEQWKSS